MTRPGIGGTPPATGFAANGPGGAWRSANLLSSRAGSTMLAAAVLVLAAFGFRAIGLTTSFELWVDEMLYAELGASVARGELPNLPDGPFFLHPPGFFIIEAAAIHLFGIAGDAMALVFPLRWVSSFCGALSVGLIFLILRRPVGVPTALVAALLAVFDPFVLRNNSRVFIETSAVLAVLIGLVLVVDHLAAAEVAPGWRGRLRLIAAGLAMGYGVFSKDVLFVCTVAPVVLAVLWRRTLPLREAALLVGATVVPYGAYLTVLAFAGELGGWFTAKSQGALRMFGFIQATGFNAPGSPSLVDRILAQLGFFGTSYVLLFVCPVAGVVAALSARADRRFLGLVAVMMGLFGVSSAAFGTFEEQYGYPVLIAGILAAAVSAVELVERFPRTRRTTAVACLVFTAAAAALGVRAEATADDGFLRVRDWTQANLPAQARVGVTNSTGELAFGDDPRFGVWPSLPDLAENGASYILTQSLPTSLGYGYAVPELLPWLAANARPMIAVTGPTNGVTTLWYIDQDAVKAGAAARVGFPPNERER